MTNTTPLDTTFQSLNSKSSPPKPLQFETLPPEIRRIIYTYLGHDTTLICTLRSKLEVRDHLTQLSAVNHKLRAEILPILRNTPPPSSSPLTTQRQIYCPVLYCLEGRFPDTIRRRIPNRVLHRICHITIIGNLQSDDLKPSLRTFPSLQKLQFKPYYISMPSRLVDMYQRIFENEDRLPSDEEMTEFIKVAKKAAVLDTAARLKQEQERPREGLERDYFVEGTLCQTLMLGREGRGFDVTMQGECVDQDRGPIPTRIASAWLEVDDWDLDRGRLKFPEDTS